MGFSSPRSAKVVASLAFGLLIGARPARAQTVSPAPKGAGSPAAKPPSAGGAPAVSPAPVAQVTLQPATPTTYPASDASTSLAGTQLVPVTTQPIPVVATPPAVVSAPAVNADLERRVGALELRLDTANTLLKEYENELKWLRMFKVSGFLQPQLLVQVYNAAASPNAVNGVLPPGITPNDTTVQPVSALTGVGTTTNGDYFRLRRARLKVEFEPVDSARFVFEIDPTPAGGQLGGVGTIAREIEAEGIARWTPHIKTEFGMGIFKIPFGFEVLQSDADRPFIERSWGERNMTPGEYDTGIRAYTTFFDERATLQAAVINGNMEGEKTFSVLPDLNQGKDIVGRINYDFGPIDVGVSGYYGQGQLVNPELLAFKQYPRGAGNFEIGVHHTFEKALGQTKLFVEGTLATNMDRGVNYGPGIGLPALPAMVVTQDVTSLHEASIWARVEQDFTHWFTLGLRFDYYTPNTAFTNNGRATYAAVGSVHFTRWLQYMLEYDHSIDNVRATATLGPAKLIDVMSNVLQVRF